MKFYWFGLGTLAVWRITHLLRSEDGPRDVFVRLRRSAGDGFWGDLLDCFYCLSLWIAVPFACWLGDSWEERLLLWPALSAASIMVERLLPERLEDPNVLLWKEEKEFTDAGRCGAPADDRV